MNFCEDLQPVLTWLQQEGYEFTVSEDRNGLLCAKTNRTVDLARLKTNLALPGNVRDYSRYLEGEAGLGCVTHGQSVGWPVPPVPVPPMCDHLNPVFLFLEASGNTVQGIEYWPPASNSWFDWVFRNWVDYEQLMGAVELSPLLTHQVPKGGHDALVEGVSCREHRQGVLWPWRKK